MIEILKQDDSRAIRLKLLENARELIETYFSEYIIGLKENTYLQFTDDYGFTWFITKTSPRCFSINVKGVIWSSTMESTFFMNNNTFPHVSKIKLETKRK
jgi:hypothetical protein